MGWADGVEAMLVLDGVACFFFVVSHCGVGWCWGWSSRAHVSGRPPVLRRGKCSPKLVRDDSRRKLLPASHSSMRPRCCTAQPPAKPKSPPPAGGLIARQFPHVCAMMGCAVVRLAGRR